MIERRPSVDRSRPRPGWSDVAWLAALFTGFAVVWHTRIGGDTLRPVLAGDSYGYFLPAYAYEADRLRAGSLPLWNPYQGGGVPFLATMQPGALYPPRLLLLVMSAPRAMAWSACLHTALALAGTYAFCRRLGAAGAGAALGAIVYVTAFELPTVVAPPYNEAGAWLPIAALATIMVVQGGGWGSVVLLALAAAMPPLSGGYQMMLYTMYAIAIVAAAALLHARRRGIDGAARAVARLAVAGILGAATAAPQLLPTWYWSAETVRRAAPLSDVQMIPIMTAHTWWTQLYSLVLPTPGETYAYLSIPVIVLALVGIVRGGTFGLVMGLGAFATGILALSTMGSLALRLYKVLPGATMFRFPIRLLAVTSLLTAATASLGLAAISHLPALGSSRRRGLVHGLALGIAVALLVVPLRRDHVLPWTDASPLASPPLPLFPAELAATDRMWLPVNGLDFELGAFVRHGMVRHVRVLQDYEPLSSRRLAAFLSAVAGEPAPAENRAFSGALWDRPMARPHLLDVVAVREIVALAPQLPRDGVHDWIPTGRKGPYVQLQNAQALPRAYVTGHAAFVADEQEALDSLAASHVDHRTTTLLVGASEDAADRAVVAAAPEPFTPTRIVLDEPERVVVDVAVEAPSVLVLADAFAPGWSVTVDGAARRIRQANYFVRAVVLQPGDRLIEFRYRSPGFALGLAICALAWVGMLGVLAGAYVRRQPPEPA